MDRQSKINIIVISILIFIVIIRGYFVLYKFDRNFLEKYSKEKVELFGFVKSEMKQSEFNKNFIFDVVGVNKEEVNFSVKVQTDLYSEYEYGQKLKIVGKLLNPFNFKSSNGRTFDYTNFLLKDGIYFEVKNPVIFIEESESKFSISKVLFSLKRSFLENLKKVLGEPHSALSGGLVVGEKSALGKDLLNDFREVGLIHIVVLSGYNITIVAESMRKVFSFLPRRIGIVFGGLSIILFGIMVGGGATVVRSCIMAVIALLGNYLYRNYNATKALFIAGFIMVIQNPMIILYDPSFQLSFIATLGLLVLSKPIEDKLSFMTESFGIRNLVSSTLATQIFISPYLLYMMGQLSIVGVLVNILVLPIIPLTMLSVFVTGVFGFISLGLSTFFSWIAYILLSYELFVVKIFSNLSFSSISVPKFPFWIVVVCYTIYFVALSKFSSTFFQFKFVKKSST